MGYHLITKNPDGSITTKYSKTFGGLLEYPEISDDSLIFEGEPHQAPGAITENALYQKYIKDEKFRAGVNAEILFKKQAKEHGLIAEPLSQDRDSYALYRIHAANPVKRGDFLLRNVGNIEIEVKCLTLYFSSAWGEHFHVTFSQVKRHEEMQRCTGVPVVLAIYERCGDAPKADSLRMIRLQAILDAYNNKSKPKLVNYDSEYKCLLVPESMAKKRFSLIDEEIQLLKKSS